MYRYRVLPFGLVSGPRDFSRLVRKVMAVLRKVGIRVTFFIDDLRLLAESQEEALAERKLALGILEHVRFRVS